MKEILFVFVGGGLGSVFRYSTSLLFPTTANSFPYPTLLANLVGCLLLGIILGASTKLQWHHGSSMIFFTVGFCGGLTTFSTLVQESYDMANTGAFLSFLLYTSLSFIGGLFLVFLGSQIPKLIS
ncbi:MAG: fluoride efflux transporter CrcB [Flavobacteriaceae bacterium]|nr:fluoride efflux transporter CrcB [Flavobacteriaceae bacterium]